MRVPMSRERQYKYELKQIKVDEDYRKMAYKDTVGKLTIGYGRNLDDRGISEDEARIMALNDLYIAEVEAIGIIGKMTWERLTNARQRVLINMSFNLGGPKLGEFKRMIMAVRQGKWIDAAAEMLDSKWATQVGNRAIRLANRMREG